MMRVIVAYQAKIVEDNVEGNKASYSQNAFPLPWKRRSVKLPKSWK